MCIKKLASLLLVIFCFSLASEGKVVPATENGFALVELFTSEGCSSCPAAEEVLAGLHREYPFNVYLLEFHVDYWNYLGWQDVFSAHEFTARQQDYARFFHLNSTYTPQAIINGKNELVGSDKEKMRRLVTQNLEGKQGAKIELSATIRNGSVLIKYKTDQTTNQSINLALVQNNALTNVKSGENSGRKLPHMNVVRVFKTIDLSKNEGEISMSLPANFSLSGYSAIAYTQDKASLRITGAASTGING